MSPVRARHVPVLRAAWLRLQALRRGEDGVSAIEFALIAPMLFFSLLAMTDVGMALYDRIRVDHVLRSGAQPAMRGASKDHVRDTLWATACQNYTVVEAECTGGPDTIDVKDPLIFCKCPGQKDDPTCTETCPVEPTKFYRLSVEKTYEPIFLPDMEALNFKPSILVQVR